MAIRTNYEDDIFFLNASIRSLRTGIALDLDTEYFLDRIVNSILFQHDILSKLHTSLKRNVYLIQRTEYLRLLIMAKREFVKFIDDLPTSGSSMIDELSPFMAQFQQCRAQQNEEIIFIQEILDGNDSNSKEQVDIISQDEYQFLFQTEGEADIV